MDSEMIDTAEMLKTFIDGLDPKSVLYVDLEGNELGRGGTLSLITILVEPRHTVHLVDVTTLKKEAFSVTGSNGTTLKQILESSEIIKVFFDIRHDSDALFSLFQVSVGGIKDLQLMQLASTLESRVRVRSLATAIEEDAGLSAADSKAWKKVKDSCKKLFALERGGDFAIFDKRPLSPELLTYSVRDVIHMPALRNTYFFKLHKGWRAKVAAETVARIALSQSADFVGVGGHMSFGPIAWQQKIKVDPQAENEDPGPPLFDNMADRLAYVEFTKGWADRDSPEDTDMQVDNIRRDRGD